MISRDRHARSSRTAPNPRNHLGRLSELDHINQYVMRTIWMGHNHPSGNPEPSAADRAVTAQLKQSLALVDVRLLDHFVIGDGPPASMAARGWV